MIAAPAVASVDRHDLAAERPQRDQPCQPADVLVLKTPGRMKGRKVLRQENDNINNNDVPYDRREIEHEKSFLRVGGIQLK